jgi:hypothetical protein
MNRQQKRALIHMSKKRNGLDKPKGAFGILPIHLLEERKNRWLKKAEKYAKIFLQNEEKSQDVVVEAKEPTID